jgi:hypothetical protein
MLTTILLVFVVAIAGYAAFRLVPPQAWPPGLSNPGAARP